MRFIFRQNLEFLRNLSPRSVLGFRRKKIKKGSFKKFQRFPLIINEGKTIGKFIY